MSSPAPNHTFENYKVLKVLGSGAFSVVYLAEQLSTGQQTAVKVLSLETGSSADTREGRILRFKREMKLCSTLYHTGIVKVLDFGKTLEGALFTVFEYVPGRTLAEIIQQEGALSVSRTFSIMEQVLSAVSCAHEKGIIHRDLKPDNIMVSESNSSDSVKLLDFGISTFVDEDRDSIKVTMTHDFIGTPAYAAPEQVRGDKATHKADIFAWGLIFIECLTGENAYGESNRARLLQKQLSSKPVPLPSSLNSTPLGSYLSWVLQKDPQRRAAESSEVHKRFNLISADSIPQSGGFLKAVDNPIYELIDIDNDEFESLSRRKISILECELSIDGRIIAAKSQLLDCLLEESFELCRTLAEKNGGWTAVSRGGRRTFYFGYPSPGDFHTRSAAKTALDISSSLVQTEKAMKVRHNVSLNWKLAIHTGDVTVRKTRGDDKVFGNTLSLAGRMCSETDYREVAASREVFERLQKSFNFHEDNNHFRLTGLREVESLFGRYKNEQLMGRSDELQRLEAIRLKSLDEGQAVIIQGEAGIGKSRFMAESVTTTSIERSSIYELLCYPENKNSALAPFLDFLRKYFKLTEYSNDLERDEALFKDLNRDEFNGNNYISLMYYWMGIQSEAFPPLELAPKKQKEMFLDMTCRLFFEQILEERSTLICDDLHWTDPTSLELLSMMLKEVQNHTCIILMSARPEFISPWDKDIISLISLGGLEQNDVKRMIEVRLGEKNISKDTIEQIVSRVDGNPLFAEEVLNSINSLAPDSTGEMKVPETLKDLFSSRLQSIGQASGTAQLASVIGRKFSYDLLKDIYPGEEGILLADLTQLLAAGFIHIVPRSNSLEYVFHHALVCENAYNSMKEPECRKVHNKVAKVLEQKFTASEADYNPLARDLSFHFNRCSDFRSALKYQQISGKQLLRLNAFKEAAEYFEQSLDSVNTLDDRKLQDTELDIKIKLGVCLKSAYGWDHSRAAELYDSAIELSEKSGGKYKEEIAPIIFGRWASVMMKMEFENALILAKQYLGFANRAGSDEVLMQAHLTLANNQFWIGDIEGTAANIAKCLKFHSNLDSQELISKGGFEPVTIAHMFDVFCTWHKGEVKKSSEMLETYLESARALNNPFSTAIMLQAASWHYFNCQESEKALKYSEELINLSSRFKLSFYEGIGLLFKGWALSTSSPEEGFNLINSANSSYINPGGGNFFSSVYTLSVVEALLSSDRTSEALKLLHTALDTALEHNENAYLPEIYRSLADISVCTGDFDKASFYLQNALTSARSKKMKVFELRASLDSVNLALITEKEPDIEQLRKLLSTLKESFSETVEAEELIKDLERTA